MGKGHDGWAREPRDIETEAKGVAISVIVGFFLIGMVIGLAFVVDWIVRRVF